MTTTGRHGLTQRDRGSARPHADKLGSCVAGHYSPAASSLSPAQSQSNLPAIILAAKVRRVMGIVCRVASNSVRFCFRHAAAFASIIELIEWMSRGRGSPRWA